MRFVKFCKYLNGYIPLVFSADGCAVAMVLFNALLEFDLDEIVFLEVKGFLVTVDDTAGFLVANLG